MWINGWIYETRHPEGFRKSEGTLTKKSGRAILEPIRDLTETEVKAIISYFDDRIRNKSPYNYIKLFTSLLLFWSRPLWEKIKWVPFQDDKLFGDFCSSAVDSAYWFAGINILPNGYEEITTPGDFMESEFFEVK